MFHVEQVDHLQTTLVQGAAELGVALTAPQVSDFIRYYRELTVWNRRMNLTALRNWKDVIVKHFLDSLACDRALSHERMRAGSLLDIGSGAGFPGLPLKILHRNLQVTLLEPNLKKTAFLRYIIGTLSLKDAIVISKRVEELAKEKPTQSFSYAVTRAVNVIKLLPLIRPLLANCGELILYRVAPLEADLDLNGFQVAREIPYELPYGYGRRMLTVLVPAGH